MIRLPRGLNSSHQVGKAGGTWKFWTWVARLPLVVTDLSDLSKIRAFLLDSPVWLSLASKDGLDSRHLEARLPLGARASMVVGPTAQTSVLPPDSSSTQLCGTVEKCMLLHFPLQTSGGDLCLFFLRRRNKTGKNDKRPQPSQSESEWWLACGPTNRDNSNYQAAGVRRRLQQRAALCKTGRWPTCQHCMMQLCNGPRQTFFSMSIPSALAAMRLCGD